MTENGEPTLNYKTLKESQKLMSKCNVNPNHIFLTSSQAGKTFYQQLYMENLKLKEELRETISKAYGVSIVTTRTVDDRGEPI